MYSLARQVRMLLHACQEFTVRRRRTTKNGRPNTAMRVKTDQSLRTPYKSQVLGVSPSEMKRSAITGELGKEKFNIS